jgi:hypothetical protein
VAERAGRTFLTYTPVGLEETQKPFLEVLDQYTTIKQAISPRPGSWVMIMIVIMINHF